MDVRLAEIDELDAIYMMGSDVWSDGVSENAYLDGCRTSEKYRLGSWYVLDHGQILLSSLIVYSSAFGIPSGYCGLGSIATTKDHRNKGHASHLVNAVCARLAGEDVKGAYLFSDIGASLYERLGFRALGESLAPCMVRAFIPASRLPNELPSYF